MYFERETSDVSVSIMQQHAPAKMIHPKAFTCRKKVWTTDTLQVAAGARHLKESRIRWFNQEIDKNQSNNDRSVDVLGITKLRDRTEFRT